MGKTWKRIPYRYYRIPRGLKNAIINKARSIPPTSWDDRPYDKQCHLPSRLADKLHNKKKWSYMKIVNYLHKRFKVTQARIISDCMPSLGYWFNCHCEECKGARTQQKWFNVERPDELTRLENKLQRKRQKLNSSLPPPHGCKSDNFLFDNLFG